jgi:hypothetical protein
VRDHGHATWQRSGRQNRFGSTWQSVSLVQGVAVHKSLTLSQHVRQFPPIVLLVVVVVGGGGHTRHWLHATVCESW